MKSSNNQKLLLVLSILIIGLMISPIFITNSITENKLDQSLISIESEDDEDEDGVDDDEEDWNEREVEFEIADDEVQIESKLKNGNTTDEFKVEIKAEDDRLKVSFEYSSEENSTETELEFTIAFMEILEFRDIVVDDIFDENDDDLIQTYEIGNFLPISYKFENRTDAEFHIFNATTIDGVFSVIVYSSNEFALINDDILSPTEVKIDIIINEFEYVEEDTALALNVKLETEGSVEYEEETEDEIDDRAKNETSIDVSLNDFAGFFSWKDYALVDGVNQSVIASTYDLHSTEQKIYLNYKRGDLIIHDPKIGMQNILINLNEENTTTPLLSVFTFSGLISAGIVAIVLVGFFRIRRKNS